LAAVSINAREGDLTVFVPFAVNIIASYPASRLNLSPQARRGQIIGSHAFDQGRYALTDANAHRRDGALAATGFERADTGHGEPGA
jgi:hypothetical protein